MSSRIKRPVTELVALYRSQGPAVRAGVLGLLAFEMVLIAATERDIQRRSADGVRGPKWLWRAVATQNVIGPAAYFRFGRRNAR